MMKAEWALEQFGARDQRTRFIELGTIQLELPWRGSVYRPFQAENHKSERIVVGVRAAYGPVDANRLRHLHEFELDGAT